MKNHIPDEIMAEVHAVKDALSREAGYDVARLIAASQARHSSRLAPASKVRSKSKKVIKRKHSIGTIGALR